MQMYNRHVFAPNAAAILLNVEPDKEPDEDIIQGISKESTFVNRQAPLSAAGLIYIYYIRRSLGNKHRSQ